MDDDSEYKTFNFQVEIPEINYRNAIFEFCFNSYKSVDIKIREYVYITYYIVVEEDTMINFFSLMYLYCIKLSNFVDAALCKAYAFDHHISDDLIYEYADKLYPKLKLFKLGNDYILDDKSLILAKFYDEKSVVSYYKHLLDTQFTRIAIEVKAPVKKNGNIDDNKLLFKPRFSYPED